MQNKFLWLVVAAALFLSIVALTRQTKTETNQELAPVAEVGNSPAKGPGDAAITIIEFSDFECPFCQKAQPVLSQLMQKYEGKVRLAYKHFPLEEVHPQARNAAIASSCAYFQGKEEAFWKYHDILFGRMDEWRMDESKFAEYAEELGLPKEGFEACMRSEGAGRWVDKDVSEAEVWGIERVPTFFVNGEKVTGAQPLEFWTRLIDTELGGGEN